jgi:hypothetical protein
MKLSPREALIAAAAGLVAAGGIYALVVDEDVASAVVALTALALICVVLQLWVLRRVVLRQQSLDRLERKLDVVARRIVTESEALSAEIRRRDM